MLKNTRTGMRLSGCETRDLGSLIAIYEQNHARLQRLIPDLNRLSDHSISRVSGMLDLHLSIMERHKFTTELMLTYQFNKTSGQVLEPNVQIRIYHDAGLAEATRHSRRISKKRLRCQKRVVASELERKWELNRFLSRWLGYCLRQGHLFLDLENTKVTVPLVSEPSAND